MMKRAHLFLFAAASLGLSSCAIKNGQLDFTWWQDAAAPVQEDDVVINNGGGRVYDTRPAPARIPAATRPLAEVEHKPHLNPQPAGDSGGTGSPSVHLVQKGDTLSALARRYNTSVSAFVAANGMASADTPLRINQQLRIPTANTVAAAPAPQPATTAPAPKPVATATPAPAASSSGTYTVRAGDTLYRIAKQHSVKAAALMQANGITPENANLLRVGTVLRIPASN